MTTNKYRISCKQLTRCSQVIKKEIRKVFITNCRTNIIPISMPPEAAHASILNIVRLGSIYSNTWRDRYSNNTCTHYICTNIVATAERVE